jgi:predicted nucleic acid-binding protein
VYLDTAIVVKLLVAEPDSSFYARLVDGQEDVWSSEVVLTEAFAALLRKERERAIAERNRESAWEQLCRYVGEGSLRLVPLTRRLLERANGLLEACHPHVPLRSLDAVHLASFDECRSPPLVTNDRILRRAAARLRFKLAPKAPGA